jgi:hypothetical protein
LDELTERKRQLSNMLGAQKSGTARLSVEAYVWAQRELNHLRKPGNDLQTWQAARARILELERKTAAAAAEKTAADEAERQAAIARAKAVDDEIRAKIAVELDPVTQWKRAHSIRTF